MRERILMRWRPAAGGALVAVLLAFAAASPARAAQGQAWAWGNNSYGQLGDNTTVHSAFPVKVLRQEGWHDLDSVKAVDGGAGHSVAIAGDDSGSFAYTWGLNSEGQLGLHDSTTDYHYAVDPIEWTEHRRSSLPSGATGVDGVSAGSFHSLYASLLGVPTSWGRNANGELGAWSVYPYRTTAFPVGLPSGGVTAVSAGNGHSLALRLDGTVFAWGDNTWGQLGIDSTTDSARPLQVGDRFSRLIYALTQVKAVAAGGDFSLALKKDGTVWAWGFNGDGELGPGATTSSPIPVQVGGLTGVIAIAAGDRHALAIRQDGTVWTWGYNGFGQLGNGTTTSSATPAPVPGLSGVIAVAGGGYHSLALLADGTVRAWGYNLFGQLGDGTTTNSATPVQVVGLDEVFAIGAGTLHSLAVRP